MKPILIVLLCLSPVFSKPESDPQSERLEWVESCLKTIESIKPGMTRRQVDAILKLEGGLQTASPGRYVHPKCPYFKTDISFDFKRDAADQNRAIMSPDDKVISVGKPYIERMIID